MVPLASSPVVVTVSVEVLPTTLDASAVVLLSVVDRFMVGVSVMFALSTNVQHICVNTQLLHIGLASIDIKYFNYLIRLTQWHMHMLRVCFRFQSVKS